MNLSLAVKEMFEGNEMNIYTNENNDVFMTREQIGLALEYSEPNTAITKIHSRNKRRLDQFSVTTKLVGTDGKKYNTVIYNEKGIYEILRYSKQPKADAFYDWVYDLLSKLRKGEYQIVQPQSEREKLQIEKMKAEARLMNARTRQAKLILDMQKNKTLSPVAVELLQINALEVITDNQTDYRPQVEKTYTATEIASELGVTANKVGRIANAYGLKTEEYGIEVLDKSRHSNKQVPSFRYNEKGKQTIKEIIGGS
ncbi:BRO-N domain-containing protein [Gracilibacillus dipsosauri]|uniref:BRO-N domain-containing protein n=1 Tax=Gracilibacillus dipsosauri TaxID=178340 RepID=UPI00240A44D0